MLTAPHASRAVGEPADHAEKYPAPGPAFPESDISDITLIDSVSQAARIPMVVAAGMLPKSHISVSPVASRLRIEATHPL
jgi:hypothetical protein